MLKELRKANTQRYAEGLLPGCDWSDEKWIVKLMEEVGELAQSIIKDKGKQSEGEESADIIITLDILCLRRGIDLEKYIPEKFNEVSVRKGSNVRLV